MVEAHLTESSFMLFIIHLLVLHLLLHLHLLTLYYCWVYCIWCANVRVLGHSLHLLLLSQKDHIYLLLRQTIVLVGTNLASELTTFQLSIHARWRHLLIQVRKSLIEIEGGLGHFLIHRLLHLLHLLILDLLV